MSGQLPHQKAEPPEQKTRSHLTWQVLGAGRGGGNRQRHHQYGPGHKSVSCGFLGLTLVEATEKKKKKKKKNQ